MSVRDEQLIRPVWPFALNHGSQQAQGLAGWWPMVHPGGERIFDLSGFGRHMTIVGGTVTGHEHGVSATRFVSASSQYAIHSAFPYYAEITVSLWAKLGPNLASGAVYCPIVAHHTTSGSASNFSLYSPSATKTNLNVDIPWVAANVTTAATVVSTDAWYHIVYRRSGGTGAWTHRLYVNGRRVSTTAGTANPNTGAHDLYLARVNVSPTTYYDLSATDFRYYGRALADEEIWALYDPPSRYDLYYPLGRRLWFIPAGTLATPLSVSGSITPAGALIKQGNKALSGSASPAGAITRQAGKGASGSIAPSGSIAGLFARALAGLITPTGAVVKLAGKLVAGTITPSGTLDALRTALLSLAGSLGLSGTITRRASKGLSGTITAAGGLAKRFAKALSGAITAAGALVSSLSSSNQQIIVTLSDEAVTIASVSDDLGG